jgi:hypothetical protein
VQFIAGPEYARYDVNNEYAFPLYLALVVLGWAIALAAWTSLGSAPLPPLPDGPRRMLAGLLIILSAGIALAWTASVVDVLNGGSAIQEYQQDMTLFWLIRLMDLAFVIPAALITGVGLLRRATWATRLGLAFVGFQTLLVAAVASMAVVMTARDDPSANPLLLIVTVAGTLALTFLFTRLLQYARRAAEPGTGESRLPVQVDDPRPAPRPIEWKIGGNARG